MKATEITDVIALKCEIIVWVRSNIDDSPEDAADEFVANTDYSFTNTDTVDVVHTEFEGCEVIGPVCTPDKNENKKT